MSPSSNSLAITTFEVDVALTALTRDLAGCSSAHGGIA